jgi:hypothetical protein
MGEFNPTVFGGIFDIFIVLVGWKKISLYSKVQNWPDKNKPGSIF